MSTAPSSEGSKRVVCGICGILIGSLGVHKFIMGQASQGILRIVITVVTCGFGSFIGLIEGIIYLTKTDAEFDRIYMVEKKSWF